MSGRSKVLLVDDRPENLLTLEAILASLDLELVKAASGEEALKHLLKDDFAVILLDVQMPGMDGFETADHIKRRSRTRNTPIIFLTAMDTELRQAMRGYAVGAVDYLAKPFDPWLLRAKVSVFVDLFETQHRLQELVRRSLEIGPALGEVHDGLDRLQKLLGEEGATPAALAELRSLRARVEPLVRLHRAVES